MDQFGGRNGIEMFHKKMEERIEKFLEVNEGSRIVYQLNDKVENECFLKI